MSTADEQTATDSDSTPDGGAESDDGTDVTKRRIRTLAIFFVGIGVYAAVGAGLDSAALLLDNLTTYFVSGGIVLAIGLLLLVLAR
jgi:hypothetical protein